MASAALPILSPILSGIGSIFGGLFGSSGARQAAGVEQAGAQKAQGVIAGNQNQALGIQQGAEGTEAANESPFLQAGQNATMQLSDLLNPNAPNSVTAPFTGEFQAPTLSQLQDPNNPQYAAYQFTQQQGQNAINNSAASKGSLFNPETSEALSQFNQGNAAQYGQQAYNNAFANYQQNYQQFQNNQANTYNRLAGVAGLGQSAAGAEGNVNTALTGQMGNTLLAGGQEQAQQIDAGAQAQAGGILGSTNALTQMFGNLGNTASQGIQLSSLMGNSSGYGPGSPQTGAYTNPNLIGPYNPNYQPQPMAKGGRVRKGQPYLVGERGPEIFYPGKDGRILPNRITLSQLAA
jgi:hypothetical protein